MCLQYIINASVDKCQPCPAGLKCHGDATFEALTINSSWVPDGNILRLQNCPSGHYVVPPGEGSVDASNAVLQKCVPCSKGEECTNLTCVTCSDCPTGKYKAAVSTEACENCPANTYREETGARELRNCNLCQAKSSTLSSDGQSRRRACECNSDYYRIIVTDYGAETETLTCEQCPRGAECSDGTCALRHVGLNCSDKSQIQGNWTLQSSGHYQLESCSAGYELRTTEEGSKDLQECFKCPSSTYILRPNVDSCQPCPPGLSCSGDASLMPTLQGSVWVQQDAIFKLESCPSGSYVFPKSTDMFDRAQQRCLPCGKGEECTTAPCVSCTPCQAGYYKASVSTDFCVKCPTGTFREEQGATDFGMCLSCQRKSSTASLAGQSSRGACVCDMEYYLISTDKGLISESLLCQTCPKGAVCGNGECALRNVEFNCSDNSQIQGNWNLLVSGHYQLESCPVGYEMRTTEERSWDLQECFKCPSPFTYILRPNVDSCQPCPLGLICHGDATLDPVLHNSIWVKDAAIFRLQKCPTGYSVSPAKVDSSNAALQKCEPCGEGTECVLDDCRVCTSCLAGTYKDVASAQACRKCPPNTFNSDHSSKSITNCLACPIGAQTGGKDGQISVDDCQCGSRFYVATTGEVGSTFSCANCPTGAVCSDGFCALRTSGFTCPDDGKTVPGRWEQSVSGEDTGKFQLISCPTGHLMQKISHDMQQCTPCGQGTECVTLECDSCSPCSPGTFKAVAGIQECSKCPPNTYNPDPRAASFTNCQACPSGADTNGMDGQISVDACKCGDRFYEASNGVAGSTFSCATCPTGATCSNGFCALRLSNKVCPQQEGAIAGTWERSMSSEDAGKFSLVSCPKGFQKQVSTVEAQRCLPCLLNSQYILDPNTHQCEKCPPGLKCNIDAVHPVVPASTWMAEDGVYKLRTCPKGYMKMSVINGAVAESGDQRCEPCAEGTECVTELCDTCSPCSTGTFKTVAGTQECSKCPPNTYNPDSNAVGFASCRTCPIGADTRGNDGRTKADACQCGSQFYLADPQSSGAALSCVRCPRGLECADGFCSIRSSLGSPRCQSGNHNSAVKGTWIFPKGQAVLTACPTGFRLLNQSGILH